MRNLVCKCGRKLSHDCLICDGFVSGTDILPNGKYKSITFACRFCGATFTVTVAELKGSLKCTQTCDHCAEFGKCVPHLALKSNGWLSTIDQASKK